MQLVAQQQRTGMVGGRMAEGRIRIGATPGQDGALSMMRSQARVRPIKSPARTSSTKSISLGGAPAARNRLLCCALLGTRGRPSVPIGSPQASAKAGQAHNQSWTS
jgi:hypothetical protein